MVSVTPELIVHVSPEAMTAFEVIVVSMVNVIVAASASWINPKDPKIKILASTGIAHFFNAHNIIVLHYLRVIKSYELF